MCVRIFNRVLWPRIQAARNFQCVLAAQETTAFICSPDGKVPPLEVEVISEALAEATASAAATAIANITIGCISSAPSSPTPPRMKLINSQTIVN